MSMILKNSLTKIGVNYMRNGGIIEACSSMTKSVSKSQQLVSKRHMALVPIVLESGAGGERSFDN